MCPLHESADGLNLAQRQQDFDMAERRARFALECLKTNGVWMLNPDGSLIPEFAQAVLGFMTESKG